MKRNFSRWFTLILAAALVVTGLSGAAFRAFATEPTVFQLADLMTAGIIKAVGRAVKTVGGITTDWTGTGFDACINVDQACDFTVYYAASYKQFYSIVIDGEATRCEAPKGEGSFSVPVEAGLHTVRVICETQNNTAESDYSKLTQVSFAGTFAAAPANKDLFIEFIGDSISCGDGALGTYQPGVEWVEPDEDAVTAGFAYKTASALDADFSIVARGGIGLLKGVTMANVYPYDGAHRDYRTGSTVEHNFSARKPDVIVVELGANDSVTASNYATWKETAAAFIEQLREKNGDEPVIVWNALNAAIYQAIDELTAKYDNLTVFRTAWGNIGAANGSATLTTQEYGHPSAEDHDYWSAALVKFLRSDVLCRITASENTSEINWDDNTGWAEDVFYVGAGGSDSVGATGTAEKPFLTMQGVFARIQARANANNGAVVEKTPEGLTQWLCNNGTTPTKPYRIKIEVIGTVLNSSATNNISQNFAGYSGLFLDAYTNEPVPILIEGYNNARGTIQASSNGTTTDNCCLHIHANNITFKNMELYGVTKPGGSGTNAVTHRVYVCDDANVTFDNVTFGADQTVTWTVSGDRLSVPGGVAGNTAAHNRITFKNGDYSGLSLGCIQLAYMYLKGNNCYDATNLKVTLTIGSGATAGTVYNRYGTMGVKESTVVIDGGTVTGYQGTQSGKENGLLDVNGSLNFVMNSGALTLEGMFVGTGHHLNITGDVNFTMNGGLFTCKRFYTTNTAVSCDNVNFTMNGGRLICNSDDDTKGVFLGGATGCVIKEKLTNTITGGAIVLNCDTNRCGMWFGMQAGSKDSIPEQENIMTGGTICTERTTGDKKPLGVYFGNYSGGGAKKLTNRIEGGFIDTTVFDFSAKTSAKGDLFFGGQATDTYHQSITNIIGKEGTVGNIGPSFIVNMIHLGSNFCQIGVEEKLSKVPATAENADTVVLKNTIYGGYFNAAMNFATTEAESGKNFVNGSVENEIYNGAFHFEVRFGAGAALILGNVSTTVRGGIFKAVFGGSKSGLIKGNVSTTVYDFTNYQTASMFTCGSDSGDIEGSVTSTVYGGTFAGDFSGGSIKGTVGGGVTTNVNGGTFSKTFSCGSWEGTVNGGVTATVSDTTSTPSFTKSFCASQSAAINGGVNVTINAGTFAEYTCIGINSGAGTITGGITTTVNGGSFNNNKNFYVGNVGTGAVTGNVTTVVNGGTFTGGFFNGNAGTGTMYGHHSLAINNATGTMGAIYGGAYSVNTTIENGVELTITKLSQTANSVVVAGSRLGAVNQGTADYAVKLLIDPEKASDVSIGGDVALGNHASGSSNTGIITGEVYGEIRNGTQAAGKKLILGNIQYGIIHGNVTLRHSGGTFGQGGVYVGTFVEDAYVSNRTTETDGNVTYIIQTSKRTPIVNTITTSGRGTYTGDSRRMAVLDCTIEDEGKGHTAQIHGTACYTANLDVKVIGGSGEFTITHNDNAVNANLADMTGGAFGVRLWNQPKANGTKVITLPDVGKDGIDLNEKDGNGAVQAMVYNKAGVGTYVVGCTSPITSPGASLLLEDRISAILHLNKADLDGWMDLMDGDWYYSYTFNGETFNGTIQKDATDNDGTYYRFVIPVNAAYLDKDIAFTCPGFSATFSVNGLIDSGIETYALDTDFVDLLKAIYNYGLAAKDMFTDEEVVGVPYDDIPDPVIPSAGERVFQYTEGSQANMHFAGTNLKLEDQVQLQIYINFADGEADAAKTTFKLGEKTLTEGEDYTLTPLDSDYIDYLETQGLTANAVFNLRLNANQMAEVYTVTALYDGKNAGSFSARVVDYCAIYWEQYPVYADLCQALLTYIDAAATYFPV